MKNFRLKTKKMMKFNLILISVLFISFVSCSKDQIDNLLTEKAISNQTAEAYFSTPDGFNDLSKSIYPLLRTIVEQRELVLNGTDIFSSSGSWGDTGENLLRTNFDFYGADLNQGLSQATDMWTYLYKNINRANTVISRASDVVGMDENLKSTRVAEAKFIRSLCLFWAVQQFGDAPMPLSETVAASKEVIRVPSSEIYAQLISDLLEAESDLPDTASDYGRATKGAAQQLLARVYLTRGWNFNNSLGGSAADFNSALEYADKVINSYPMVANYKDLWPKRDENVNLQSFGPADQDAKNSEVVFAVQFSDQAITNAMELDELDFKINSDGGSNAASIFGGLGEEWPGYPGRTPDYGRIQGYHHTTPATYRLFDPNTDQRYDHNFVEKVWAMVDQPGFIPAAGVDPIDISSGDLIIEFRPWDSPLPASERGINEGGNKLYAVVNHADYGRQEESNYMNRGRGPMMWKFWEPGIQWGSGFGQYDVFVMRSAEAYLIAAEAIVKGATGGQLGSASDYYNTVVNRAIIGGALGNANMAADPTSLTSLATKSYRSSGNVTIDMILDERAREFMGEGLRWYDLKRTGKLIERAKAMNPWVGDLNFIQEYHLLRPIPLKEIDLASGLTQNPGY
jgi:hypothetical protein